MKKFILLSIVLCLMALPVVAQETETANNIVYGGGRYDTESEKAISFTIGYATPISGGLYSFNSIDMGVTPSVNINVAYFFDVNWIMQGLSVGFIEGPKFDWVPPDNVNLDDYVNYVVNASGVILSYDMENFGVAANGEYRFSYVEDNAYVDGYSFGLSIFKKF